MTQALINEIFVDYHTTIAKCLSAAGLTDVLAERRPIMLKPNLVNDSPHPVTTPPALCAALIQSLREVTDAPMVIAEGCGDAHLDTMTVFGRLGYLALSRRFGVPLLDLNEAPLVELVDESCSLFPRMWLPEAAFTHTLISLPVLKAHSLCRFTGSMKNMMGLAPPEHYAGRWGTWKKAAFHHRLDQAIVELNRYRSPDFTVLDATVGLADFHLGGAHCKPPVNRILAGADARAVDRSAAGLLGIDWHAVGHLV